MTDFATEIQRLRTRAKGLHPGRAGTAKGAISVVRRLSLLVGELADKTSAKLDHGWRYVEEDLHALNDLIESRRYEFVQNKVLNLTDVLNGILQRITAGPKYGTGYYTSRTASGRSKSWPVELLRTGDFYHVRGLTGRFKGRTFSIVPSEYSTYARAKVQYSPHDRGGRRLERELSPMSSIKKSWQGTNFIEGRFNSVRNALAGIYLDGIEGISPYRNHPQVPIADAERYLAKGREVLAWMEEQRPAPTAQAKRWMKYKVEELARLLRQAEAIHEGTPQKMTETDYQNLLTRRSPSRLYKEGRKISYTALPKAALAKLSADQRSYIDEFTFIRQPNGHIDGYYANELLASWDGHGWRAHSPVRGVERQKLLRIHNAVSKKLYAKSPSLSRTSFRYLVVFDWAGVKAGRSVGQHNLAESEHLANQALHMGRKNVFVFDAKSKRVVYLPQRNRGKK
jgi:hypothetical protein